MKIGTRLVLAACLALPFAAACKRAPARVEATPVISATTVVFLGDSITELGNYSSLVAAQTGIVPTQVGFRGTGMGEMTGAIPNTYYDQFCMYRLADAIASDNLGAVTDAADGLLASKGPDLRLQAAELAATNWAQVDYLVIFYGTNDWGHGLPLGKNTDITGATFKGAINHTVSMIRTAFPEMQIVLITPLFRANADTLTNTEGLYLADYANALLERGAAYKLPVLDLLRVGDINNNNASIYLADGIHPTTAGMQRIADKLAPFLVSLMARKTSRMGGEISGLVPPFMATVLQDQWQRQVVR
jgi:lysophospholipase L1-like esterase